METYDDRLKSQHAGFFVMKSIITIKLMCTQKLVVVGERKQIWTVHRLVKVSIVMVSVYHPRFSKVH